MLSSAFWAVKHVARSGHLTAVREVKGWLMGKSARDVWCSWGFLTLLDLGDRAGTDGSAYSLSLVFEAAIF